MVSYAAPARQRVFSVGETMQATFAAIGANFVTLFCLSLVLVGIPRLVITFLTVGLATSITRSHTLSSGFWLVWLGSIVSLFTTMILQASTVRVAVTYLNGRRPSIMESLSAVTTLILPLVAIAILNILGVAVGFIVLVVPGIFLLLAWSMAIPVEVIERKGVFASFSRSFQLTSGFRWAILGVLLLMFLLSALIGFVGQMAAMFLNMLLLSGGGGVATRLTIPGMLVSSIAVSISAVFQASAVAAIYSELRRAKEGATPQSLASVFD